MIFVPGNAGWLYIFLPTCVTCRLGGKCVADLSPVCIGGYLLSGVYFILFCDGMRSACSCDILFLLLFCFRFIFLYLYVPFLFFVPFSFTVFLSLSLVMLV